MDYELFGSRIRQARQAAHITQAELARRLGVSVSFMGHIERGTRAVSMDTLLQLCRELSVPPSVFLQDNLSIEALRRPEPIHRLHEQPDNDKDYLAPEEE